jgi:hypothetical protein
MIPALFSDGRNPQDTYSVPVDIFGKTPADGAAYMGAKNLNGDTAAPRYGNNGTNRNGLVEHALKGSVVGLKFNMAPLEIAAQFKVRDSGAYFGMKFTATDSVSLGLSFMGLLTPADENLKFRFGGQFDFNGGDFGANVQAWYTHIEGNEGNTVWNTIAIEPSFFYRVIPSHLGFRLNAGFYFDTLSYDAGKTEEVLQTPVVWAVQPMLFWNFRGNGAFTNSNDGNGYNWGGTSMLVRYKIVNGSVTNTVTTAKGTVNQPGNNALDILFNWGF